jgi:hypothetical protein
MIARVVILLLVLAWLPGPASAYAYARIPEPDGEMVTIEVRVTSGRIVAFEAFEGDNPNPTPACQGSIRHLTCTMTAGRDTSLGVEWSPEQPSLCGREPRIVITGPGGVLLDEHVPTTHHCAYLPRVG